MRRGVDLSEDIVNVHLYLRFHVLGSDKSAGIEAEVLIYVLVV